MNTREQGDFGELSAMQWLATEGASLAVPIGHSPHWDVVAELDGQVLRVQVKTTTRLVNDKRWHVMLCTKGGNQSWNGIVKRLDASRYEYLFVHVGDGRRWFIPSAVLDGAAGVLLGGPKYAAFEVEPGQPIPSRRSRAAALKCSTHSRRDTQAVNGTRL